MKKDKAPQVEEATQTNGPEVFEHPSEGQSETPVNEVIGDEEVKQEEMQVAPPPEPENNNSMEDTGMRPTVDMLAYIGSKILGAAAMNLGEYNLFRGWDIPKNEDPLKEGYLVQYQDGYHSWSPKEIFDAAYRSIEGAALLPNGKVFPAENSTIFVVPDADYGGAHRYLFQNSLGFKDGAVQYDGSVSFIQFVQKEQDGTMIPGVQSEQLILALMDRHNKLNQKFPSAFHAEGMAGLQMFLDAQRKRVEDRMVRGVMGDLKR